MIGISAPAMSGCHASPRHCGTMQWLRLAAVSGWQLFPFVAVTAQQSLVHVFQPLTATLLQAIQRSVLYICH